MLLTTWRDIFYENVRNISKIDLIIYRIFIYDHIIFKMINFSLYTSKKIAWQRKNLSKLKKTNVLTRCENLWIAKIKFIRKSDKKSKNLKITYIFNSINVVTIKFNYFIRKMKSIIKSIKKNVLKFFIQTKTFHNYYVITFWKSYVYKTKVIIALEQYCYLVINFNLINESSTYIKMKNITIEKISKFNIKSILLKTIQKKVYDFYMNDDIIDALIFNFLFIFLHEHYFSRLSWARLTLNSKKTRFFIKRM